MLARVRAAAVLGVQAFPVLVEADLQSGLPTFSTVGLPDEAVRESRDRVRAAIVNSGFAFPAGRVTVNLAPADLRKEGSAFDLAIAVGLLAAQGLARAEAAAGLLLVGELSLDGGLKEVRGVLVAGAREVLRQGPAALGLVRAAPGTMSDLAAIFSDDLRRKDLLGRYSETQLAVLMPGATAGVPARRIGGVLDIARAVGLEQVCAGVTAPGLSADRFVEPMLAEAESALSTAQVEGTPVVGLDGRLGFVRLVARGRRGRDVDVRALTAGGRGKNK